jgi:hypothetical protein
VVFARKSRRYPQSNATARAISAVAGCRVGCWESQVCDLAIRSKMVIRDLPRLCSSFLLVPRCTKTDANTAAIFRYEFNACGLQGTTDR